MGKGYIHRTIKAILGRREAENEATESKKMKHDFGINKLKAMGLIQLGLPVFLITYFVLFPVNWSLLIAGLLTGFLFWTIMMAGFHRILSHNIVKTNSFIKCFYCFIGSMAAASPPIALVATHIMHHQHFNTDKDPQNPNVHGWYTFLFYWQPSFAEVMDKLTITEKKKFIIKLKNLLRDPILIFFEKNYLVLTLMLALPRRIYEGSKIVVQGKWNGWSPTHMLGSRIHGKRLGIIGMGRIGQAIAKRAKVFGISIHYHNRNQLPSQIEDAYEATYWKNLGEMVKRMDIVSINCPLTEKTKGMISENILKIMMPNSYIINSSRSEIIDEKALVRMLQEKKNSRCRVRCFRCGKKT